MIILLYDNTILYECHIWIKGVGVGTTDKLPDNWKFSNKRIEHLLKLT